MISPAFITEWSQQCPWISPAQVEQDLVLSRGLVEIYSDPILRERLLFRGGTALHKIVLKPAARYSEDLDFVQLREEPIGSTLDLLRERMNPWLGEPKCDIGPRGATLIYRFESELPPVIRLRLKIEINTREHLCLLPIQQTRFAVESRWFTGEATLPIYATTELLGTKLRALYQRRKGRDLFDLWQSHQAGVLDVPAVADAFAHYMQAGGKRCSVGLLPSEESGVFWESRCDSDALAEAICLQRQQGFSPENVSVTACDIPASFE